jgi:ubiquinone/menaquinone biosynthesis C-methylase UbiE
MTDDSRRAADGPTDGDHSRATVRETYEHIGSHFSKTREYAWPEVETFLDARSGEVGLDIGCGNGRHTELLADHCARAVGLDASRAVLEAAAERRGDAGRGYALVDGDAGALPVSESVVDLAVYVATLHHLPTREGRVASLDELARVLAPGGRALVSAWSTEHDRFDAVTGFDTTVDWTLPGGESVERFYHIYDPDEFRADAAESGLALVDFEVSSGNCYGVVRVG